MKFGGLGNRTLSGYASSKSEDCSRNALEVGRYGILMSVLREIDIEFVTSGGGVVHTRFGSEIRAPLCMADSPNDAQSKLSLVDSLQIVDIRFKVSDCPSVTE